MGNAAAASRQGVRSEVSRWRGCRGNYDPHLFPLVLMIKADVGDQSAATAAVTAAAAAVTPAVTAAVAHLTDPCTRGRRSAAHRGRNVSDAVRSDRLNAVKTVKTKNKDSPSAAFCGALKTGWMEPLNADRLSGVTSCGRVKTAADSKHG